MADCRGGRMGFGAMTEQPCPIAGFWPNTRDDPQRDHFGPRRTSRYINAGLVRRSFPYACYRHAVHPMRPVSSVYSSAYSDPFELEDVPRQLPGSVYDNHVKIIQALEGERDALQHQRNVVRSE
jgi:hypothetical protein